MGTATALTLSLFALTSPGIGQTSLDVAPVVIVYVQNERAPTSVVRQAQRFAGAMFADINVTIDWRYGEPSISLPTEQRVLAVQIAGETPQGFGPSALASSKPREGVDITVSYDRVKSRFHRIDDSPLEAQNLTSRVLAHVLAHEIGHMLQGSNRHSKDGIMKAFWTLTDLRNIELGRIRFEPEDERLIHDALKAHHAGTRAAAESSDENSPALTR